MPFGEVKLIPGVNVERTPTLNQAAISQSQLIRFKDGLAQKYGGWHKYFAFALSGAPRDLHAWEDLNQNTHLAVGTTTRLNVITGGGAANITPQTLTSDFVPAIQTTAGSTTAIITDPNVSGVTVFDAVLFNTPVSAGGVIISGGPYQIIQINGADVYEITIPTAAINTNTLATSGTTASGNNTLNFSSVPSWVIAGMQVVDITTSGVIPPGTVVQSTTTNTIVMTNNATGAGVGSGDQIVLTYIPSFTTQTNNASVTVNLASHGLTAGTGVAHQINFPIATTGNGVTIKGTYTVTSVSSANAFSVLVSNQASGGGTFYMDGGLCELVYYIALGPAAAGQGYGLGGYGDGGYGTGTSSSSIQTGAEITASDYTQDNWGEILLSCPSGGGIYQYDPTQGFANSAIVSTAPPFNGGMFVSTALQILMAWGSTQQVGIGKERDPLLINWSDQGDYTNFTPVVTNQAGAFRIPTGSTLMAGAAVFNQNVFWTDIDTWVANYLGQPFVFGFNKVGSGSGAISSHSVQQLRTGVYWMGPSNFYSYTGGGVTAIPCPVWDAVFQNLNTDFQTNVRAMPNTPFNEVGWLYPSADSSNGECDSYVKFNITEPGSPWDYGSLPRSAWIDQTILGPPIAATPTGIIYQHETTNDADGSVLAASFTTGYAYISEGEDFAFLDQIFPDFIYGTFSSAKNAVVQIAVNAINYETDTPTVYGPYTVTQGFPAWISTRIRARQISFTISSNDIGSFWRLGKIRYRYSPDGRR